MWQSATKTKERTTHLFWRDILLRNSGAVKRWRRSGESCWKMRMCGERSTGEEADQMPTRAV
jgi:hypothetical protein